jgi:hypothetical protein
VAAVTVGRDGDVPARPPSRTQRYPRGLSILAGQTATHSKHPVHSTDRTCTSLSTGNADGHAFAHLAQSIHVLALRVICIGLRNETRPGKPPYGQR